METGAQRINKGEKSGQSDSTASKALRAADPGFILSIPSGPPGVITPGVILKRQSQE